MTDIDPRLRTALGHRAEQIDVTGDFALRAIEIEHRAYRRRVASATLGGALALAVTAPFVYSAMTPQTTQPLPAGSTTVTTPAPTPTSSAPVPTASAPTTVAPTAIPTFDTGREALATALPKFGPATGTPDVPYAVDGVLHDGDREVPLPARTGIYTLARLDHGGAFLMWNADTGGGSALVDAAGKVIDMPADYTSVVVSEDRSRFLAAGPIGVLRVLSSRGDVLAERKTAHVPGALVGDLAFAPAVEGPETLVWNTVTGETRTIQGTVRDVNAQRGIALVLERQDLADPSKVCYSILDVETLTARSRACGPVAPIRFSPQGTYLLGTGTYDGGGPLTLDVVRVDDGRVVLQVDDSIGAWTFRMNEAESALTFSASEGGPEAPTTNALVRCELSGNCTVVGDARQMEILGGGAQHEWTVSDN